MHWVYFMYSIVHAANGYLLESPGLSDIYTTAESAFWQHPSRCSISIPRYLPWRNPHTCVPWDNCKNGYSRYACNRKTLEIAKTSTKRKIYKLSYMYIYIQLDTIQHWKMSSRYTHQCGGYYITVSFKRSCRRIPVI